MSTRWVEIVIKSLIVLMFSGLVGFSFFLWLVPLRALGQTQVIPCALPGGQVVVIHPAPSYVNKQMAAGMTRAQVLDAIQQKDAPAEAVCGPPVDRATLPGRRFRDAWREAGGAVVVDLPLARQQRARELGREIDGKIQASADRELAASDADDLARQAAHKAHRNHLRALQAALAAHLGALMTPEALHAWTPIYRALVE